MQERVESLYFYAFGVLRALNYAKIATKRTIGVSMAKKFYSQLSGHPLLSGRSRVAVPIFSVKSASFQRTPLLSGRRGTVSKMVISTVINLYVTGISPIFLSNHPKIRGI